MSEALIHSTVLAVLGLFVLATLPLWWTYGHVVAFDLAMAGVPGCF
jgi:hypothetical protein